VAKKRRVRVLLAYRRCTGGTEMRAYATGADLVDVEIWHPPGTHGDHEIVKVRPKGVAVLTRKQFDALLEDIERRMKGGPYGEERKDTGEGTPEAGGADEVRV